MDKLQEAGVLIKNTKAKVLINEIIEDIRKKNKLFKLVDNLETGWELVHEYLNNDAASDSDDDRKIRQAEQRALRKN